jgi:Recombination endonuclease VII
MLMQNLERRFEKRIQHSPGFVINVLPKKNAEVYMTDIIKVCKNCGDLKKHQCILIKSINKYKCKFCINVTRRKHRENNRELLNQKSREYRKNNIERIRARDRQWKAKDYKERKYIYVERAKRFYKNNPEKTKNRRLITKYGITIEQYNEMLIKQNNLCFICRKPESAFHKNSNKVKDLCVDHCHKTGKARALLCANCNCLIGYSNESIEILQEAINYLKGFEDDKPRE